MDKIIDRKIQELESYIKQLRIFQKYSYEEIEKDKEKLWAVEHGLQISIQIIMDVGNHIIAKMGENQIENYTDVFDRLAELNILPKEFAESIRLMVGFRNIIVHRYSDVNIHIVYDILQNKLYDFERFIGYIQSHF